MKNKAQKTAKTSNSSHEEKLFTWTERITQILK